MERFLILNKLLMDKLTIKFLRQFVNLGVDNCWGWLGIRDKLGGYGWVCAENKRKRAHVISYLFFKGEITRGLHVRHLCHNPICTNPKHLELGTHLDNHNDSMVAGRLATKIPIKDYTFIGNLQVRGVTLVEIASMYGCTKQAVRHVLLKMRRKNVKN